MNLKLYGSARSRTTMPRWYLEGKGGRPLMSSTPSPGCQHSDHHAHEFTSTAAEVAAQRALANQWILFANATLAVALVCACQPGAGVPAVAGGASWVAGKGLGAIQPGALPTGP